MLFFYHLFYLPGWQTLFYRTLPATTGGPIIKRKMKAFSIFYESLGRMQIIISHKFENLGVYNI